MKTFFLGIVVGIALGCAAMYSYYEHTLGCITDSECEGIAESLAPLPTYTDSRRIRI